MTTSHLSVVIREDTGGEYRPGRTVAGFETRWREIAAEFPTVEIGPGAIGQNLPTLSLSDSDWTAPGFPFYELDYQLDQLADSAGGGPFRVSVTGDEARLPDLAFEVLTRCQRRIARRNTASRGPLFDRVLAAHRALHDLDKPLVRADWAHSRDVWQWTVRLDPDASLAVQLAALFHDVERLVSEADRRVEHRASDYQAFKDEHARRGAEMADAALSEAGVDAATRARAARLIGGHEHPPAPGDPDADDLALLNDADALSFFSLNSPGYLDWFGPEPTRRKVAFTLGRLRPAARARLDRIRLRPDVRDILKEIPAETARPMEVLPR